VELPPFTDEGSLPPGDYPMTLDQLRLSPLVLGPEVRPLTWDGAWRLRLVNNLEVLVRQLWRVGIEEIFINGSFVEERDHPNDIDGYFACDQSDVISGRLERELNRLDPYRVWTWDPTSRRPAPDVVRWQLPMWHVYRVELYPHFGQVALRDPLGHELQFPAAFRWSRLHGAPKGIVQLIG
jgi:hypothetical protein